MSQPERPPYYDLMGQFFRLYKFLIGSKKVMVTFWEFTPLGSWVWIPYKIKSIEP